MNRLVERFDVLRTTKRKCLLPYITAGHPDLATTFRLLETLDDDRLGAIELGIPFSDPIADGPVIQASFHQALQRGFRVAALLDGLRNVRHSVGAPLIAMVSYSIVFRRGPDRFVDEAREAGFDGLIVPDLAQEECAALARHCHNRGMCLILMAAPSTSHKRLQRVSELSEPFVYFQAVAGITGERAALPADLKAQVTRLRDAGGKPVCVGFGISSPRQVADVCAVADGAIVGSAIVRRIQQAASTDANSAHVCSAAGEYVRELTAAL